MVWVMRLPPPSAPPRTGARPSRAPSSPWRAARGDPPPTPPPARSRAGPLPSGPSGAGVPAASQPRPRGDRGNPVDTKARWRNTNPAVPRSAEWVRNHGRVRSARSPAVGPGAASQGGHQESRDPALVTPMEDALSTNVVIIEGARRIPRRSLLPDVRRLRHRGLNLRGIPPLAAPLQHGRARRASPRWAEGPAPAHRRLRVRDRRSSDRHRRPPG